MSPLTYSWSYFSAILDLLNFENGIVKTESSTEDPGINLNCFFDDFYDKNLFTNYADLAKNIKEELSEL